MTLEWQTIKGNNYTVITQKKKPIHTWECYSRCLP